MASLLNLRKEITSIISLLRYSSLRHIQIAPTPLFHLSTQIQHKKDLPFIAQYLISSFGFSEDRALRVASRKDLSPIKTPDRPESVVCFLKDTGLTDAQVKATICLSPQVLSRSVSKTLERWVREVINGGFTRETIIQLIVYNPTILSYRDPIKKLQFWKKFVGNDEEIFRKFIKKGMVLTVDIDKKLIPRINLFKEYGCSEKEVLHIFKTYGAIVRISEAKFKTKMDFLIGEVGLKLKCIIDHPYLLTASLERNLVPRHYVASVLKSKGLLKNMSFFTLVPASEAKFIKICIKKYEKEVLHLAEAYASIRDGKTPFPSNELMYVR